MLLNVGQLFYREFVLIWTDFLLPQKAKESQLVFKQEKESSATTLRTSASSTDTVNIVIRIIGRVVLDDPIDLREVKASLGNVSAQKNASLGLTELKVGRCTLLLFLLAVNVLKWYVDVIEQIRVIFDSIAA